LALAFAFALLTRSPIILTQIAALVVGGVALELQQLQQLQQHAASKTKQHNTNNKITTTP